jgi:hypothetical protein
MGFEARARKRKKLRTWARKGRKIPATPRLEMLANRWHPIGNLHPCLGRDRSSSWKAHGIPSLEALNPPSGFRDPGSANTARLCRRVPSHDVERQHAPAALPLRSFPQPIGAGSLRPLAAGEPGRTMSREGSVSRLQGRKTLASPPEHGRANGRTR